MTDPKQIAETVARLQRQCDQSEALGDTPSDGAAWRIEAAGVLARVAKAGFTAADLLQSLAAENAALKAEAEASAARLAEVEAERGGLLSTWAESRERHLAAEAERDRLAAELAEARVTLLRTAAPLAAAISLLERGGKKAAASDKMFGQMLTDYRNALGRARAYLTTETPT